MNPPRESTAEERPSRLPLVPLILLLLALGDLRTELQLLFDHLTLTSLLAAIANHPLAVAVLIAQPSLWRRYRRPR
mgnify:FL=1